MCLTNVDEKTKKGRGYGYKCFKETGGMLFPIVQPLKGGRAFPEGVWFSDARRGQIYGGYPKGFHIATEKKGALRWLGTYRKVFYKDVVASGTFSLESVIVARQIWITKEEI